MRGLLFPLARGRLIVRGLSFLRAPPRHTHVYDRRDPALALSHSDIPRHTMKPEESVLISWFLQTT